VRHISLRKTAQARVPVPPENEPIATREISMQDMNVFMKGEAGG
jgi:hypothetical protein